MHDSGDQFPQVRERSGSYDPTGNFTEESFDHVEPGGRSRREVHVEARVLLEPGPHLRVFVRGVVVENQMDVQHRIYFAVDLLEKGEPFLMAMLLLGCGDDFAAEVVERGKEGSGSVPVVVVRAGSNVACAQGQARLAAFQGLALALLIATKDDGFL